MSRRAGCRVVLIGRSGGRSLTNEQNYHRANEFCFRFFNLETFKAATTTTFTATATTTTKTTMPQTPSRCRDCTRLSDQTDGQPAERTVGRSLLAVVWILCWWRKTTHTAPRSPLETLHPITPRRRRRRRKRQRRRRTLTMTRMRSSVLAQKLTDEWTKRLTPCSSQTAVRRPPLANRYSRNAVLLSVG